MGHSARETFNIKLNVTQKRYSLFYKIKIFVSDVFKAPMV